MWYDTCLIIRGCPVVSSNLSSGVFFNLFFTDFKALQNKFVRTKMRPKEGTKIELQRKIF